ncbi:MAG: hypothetical protein Q4B01_00440 [Eubacteriales bacterium]|nr:hypothetical protein [Eubacteriales bacterium]
MKKTAKGKYGYLKYEKKKRTLITAVMFAIPLVIYITGLLQTGTRKNMFTFVAIMGCLPASRSAIGMILVLLQKPMQEALYRECQEHVRDLDVLYECVVSSEKRNTSIACIVLYGLNVICYSEDPKLNASETETHIKKILQGNGFRSNVKIFTEKKGFFRRVDELYALKQAGGEQIPFKPNEQYPDATREELVAAVIKAVSV